jgi:Asp-tRNA(Asn)/Glu-tRNA(Gln) amidotransferase A subunit family amidase
LGTDVFETPFRAVLWNETEFRKLGVPKQEFGNENWGMNSQPLTIYDAITAMRAGTLTPVELLDQCLARIDRYESLIRAWVVIDRDGAREQAQRLTDEQKRGQVRGPLHGIPVGIKDIIDVFDLPTGCGSRLWANSIARQDAPCVARLRAAGAVVLGKTVTTAYAYLDPAVTRNPWNPSRTPGGSSSGSAAAVTCGMCLAALGTQTVGSITRPASFCGICSVKPSHGMVSTAGVLPCAPTLDHVGAMARSVGDLAILAGVLCGINDPEARGPEQFTVVGGIFEDRAEPTMRTAMGRLRETLNAGSAELPTTMAEMPRHLRAILATEAAAYHGERLRRHPDDYSPKIRDLIEEGLRTPLADYQAALGHRTAMIAAVDVLLDDGGYLVTPATLGAAPDRSTTGDAAFNALWSYTGHSTVSLPIGRTEDGLPLAAQLVGRRSELPRLLAAAAEVERQVGFVMELPALPDGNRP